jgi:translation initiation factor 1
MDIENLQPKDIDFDDLVEKKRPLSNIHIRLQQRNGKKMITIIEGLAEDLDLKKVLRALKNTFQTNGAILRPEEDTAILQLNGDQRENVRSFFTRYKIWEPPDPPIKIHGF